MSLLESWAKAVRSPLSLKPRESWSRSHNFASRLRNSAGGVARGMNAWIHPAEPKTVQVQHVVYNWKADKFRDIVSRVTFRTQEDLQEFLSRIGSAGLARMEEEEEPPAAVRVGDEELYEQMAGLAAVEFLIIHIEDLDTGKMYRAA